MRRHQASSPFFVFFVFRPAGCGQRLQGLKPLLLSANDRPFPGQPIQQVDLSIAQPVMSDVGGSQQIQRSTPGKIGGDVQHVQQRLGEGVFHQRVAHGDRNSILFGNGVHEQPIGLRLGCAEGNLPGQYALQQAHLDPTQGGTHFGFTVRRLDGRQAGAEVRGTRPFRCGS